jgi:hypothetical protein
VTLRINRENKRKEYLRVRYLKDGEPCGATCLNHVSHPCDDCGRLGARGEAAPLYDKNGAVVRTDGLRPA